MRRSSRLIVWALLVLPAAACAQVPCSPETLQPNQNRTEMKHRAPAPDSVATDALTVAGMINLSVPTIATPAEREQETPLTPQEGKVLELTGDLWHVKLAADDCDFHLELAAPGAGSTADRVIVEIPQGAAFEAARKALVAALKKKHVKIRHADVPHDLKTPLRVKVRGFAFFDAWHATTKEPKRGHAHGSKHVATLWEIHPVWKIVPNP